MTTPFRYEDADHSYYLEDEQIPSITQMLTSTGHIDDRWFTEESSERGTAIHGYAADYDLGALNLERVPNKLRGWVLAHIELTTQTRPQWHKIEVASVHPGFRFGGRPDRIGVVRRVQTIREIKSGAPHKAHPIQLALQAILESHESKLPATSYQREAEYLKQSGRFQLVRYTERRDFDEAHAVIRACCPRKDLICGRLSSSR